MKKRGGGANTKEQPIYITLHANSCNSQVSKFSVLGNYKDPSLTQYGILSMLRHNPEHIVDQDEYKVFVSCCVSTWMTAILLYGRKCTTLKLVVAPFLNDDGLNPAPIDIQRKKMDKFKQFLIELDRTHADSLTVQLNSTNACKMLQCKVSIVLPYADGGSLYEWTPDGSPSSCNSEELKYSSYPNAVDVPLVATNSDKQIIPDSPISMVPENTTTYAYEMTKYYNDGILRFCSWIPNKEQGKPIYAVSHSKLMRQALLSFGANLPGSVTTSDAWTVKIETNIQYVQKETVQITKYSAGVHSAKGNLDELCSSDTTVGQELYKSVGAVPGKAVAALTKKVQPKSNPFSAARQWFNQTFTRKRPMNETEFQQNGDGLILRPRGADKILNQKEVNISFGGRSKRGKKRRTQRKR